MLPIHNKIFKALSNSANGEVGAGTLFYYREEGNKVFATYAGGEIKAGTLEGTRTANTLQFTYQHENILGEQLQGKCKTNIKRVNGKIRLYESWQWTCKDFSTGNSILEEVETTTP